MIKKISTKSEETKYLIPIDGTYHETTEDVYKAYYQMDRRERYLQERSTKNELSLEGLEEAAYPVEMKMVRKQETTEEIFMSEFLVEMLFKAIGELAAKDKWIIEQVYLDGKTPGELSEETGIPRSTLQSRKEAATRRIQKRMIEDYQL